MPAKLSERPEELLRQYLVDNLTPSSMQGYDPQQTDTTATDFLPISNSWSKWGDYYPFIFVGEQNGPQIPGGGSTNVNGIGPDGPNQYAVHNITISVQVAEGGAYRNSTEYDALAHDIYSEIHSTIQNNTTSAISEALIVGVPTPPTPTRNPGEDDSDTLDWYQLQGTVPVEVLNTP